MEKKEENGSRELCNDCKNLIGKGRYDPPHENLKKTGFRPFESMFGSVDEYYYTCKICGTDWLHEKGSYGEGWVPNQRLN